MEIRKQLLRLFLLKDELQYFHKSLVIEKNPFDMFRIIKQNLVALNTFLESLNRYNLYIKQNPELKEITRSIRKRGEFITHMRHKVGGHLDDEVLIRSAQWIPYIFHEKSKENREFQIGLSYQALLESAINSYKAKDEKQKEFGEEINLNYPSHQTLFFSFLETMNVDSIEWIKSVIDIIERDFLYFNDDEALFQSKIAGFTNFNLKNDFKLPNKEQLESNVIANLILEVSKETNNTKKVELLNKLIRELDEKIKEAKKN